MVYNLSNNIIHYSTSASQPVQSETEGNEEMRV